jgi:NhaP-type Na+/H+ or K+/H+ antiporter
LVFEAAFHLRFNESGVVEEYISPAVPGVILTMLIVGAFSRWAGISLPVALTFGALFAATDPVAVVSIFRCWSAETPGGID